MPGEVGMDDAVFVEAEDQTPIDPNKADQIVVLGDDGQTSTIHELADAEELLKAYFFGGRNATFEEGESRAMPVESWEKLASGETIPPPANPDVWSLAAEKSSRTGRCVRTYARNVVGLGWSVVPKDPKAAEDPAIRKQVEAELKLAQALFQTPNQEMPFTTLSTLMKIDEETTGNGYFEVARNLKNEIANIYHVPAVTMRHRVRRHAGERISNGFVQIRSGEKRYFKAFGDERILDAITGQWQEDTSEPIPRGRQATEIIQFKIYTPRSSFYGVPRFVSAAAAITGNQFAAIRNVSFFENDATPRMMIIVQGGKLDDQSLKAMREFFDRQHKGVANAHRVCILQPQPKQNLLSATDKGVRIQVVPLTVGGAEDASHTNYRAANNEEIRECFGLSEAFFQTSNVNRASAQVGRETTNEQEFEPDRIEKEYIINQQILGPRGLNLKLVEFKYTRLDTSGPVETTQIDRMLDAMGSITPNEVRKRMGMEPFPENYVFANKPFALAIQEMQLGIALAIAAGTQPPGAVPPGPPPGAPAPAGAATKDYIREALTKFLLTNNYVQPPVEADRPIPED